MQIHIHIHHHHEGAEELNAKLNKIIMKQDEAVILLNKVADQLSKVKDEVQNLVDTAANAGNVSPELQAAIDRVSAATTAVDDLNPDAPAGDGAAVTAQ